MLKSGGARSASKSTLTSSVRLGVSLTAVAMAATGLFAVSAQAQDAAAAKPAAEDTVVIVTGFRGSLQTAMNAKKKEDMIVDVIKSEDIAQFPDLNLAESLQRIPGVSIDRDGGEGRSITVRGLNSDFSRTRLNGLEAQATTGGKDSSGGANRGRGFDFNVFASDLFNSITVRKSLAAEIEEGSLGATVDLQTARPFDYKGFSMAASYQAGYNDLSKTGSGRGSFLISNRWAGGKLGMLFSLAAGQGTIQEEGPNTTRWENAYSASNVGRMGAFSTDGGTTFTNITPCTGSTAACNTVETSTANPAVTGEALKLSEALHPRIPRYSKFVTDQKRLGSTFAFQMRPNPDTLITLDAMYAVYSANRDEYDLEAISFSRNTAGLPKTKIYNYTIDDEKTITKASFNNVDIRAEHRYDELKTTFTQVNLAWDQQFGDKLKMKALIGVSESLQDNPEQTTLTYDAYDVQGYSYDFTNSRSPTFNYGTKNGCTVDQACYWSYSPNVTTSLATQPGSTNGTTTPATTQGDASLIRIRPQSVDNKFDTTKVDFVYELNDDFAVKFGTSLKHFGFYSTELGRVTLIPASGIPTRDEAANSLWSTGFNTLMSNIAANSLSVSVGGNTFLVPNIELIRATTGYDCRCTNSYGTFTVDSSNSSSRANNRNAHEKDSSSYAQLDFHRDIFGMPVRGNIGVRVVQTDLDTTGLIGKGTINVSETITRSYTDTLPSLNVSVQPFSNFFVRFAASKTMSRPTLQSLSPGGSITTSTQVMSIGNPLLNPVRAGTYDLSLEWYPDKESLFSLSLFDKDITSYIQTQVRQVPFSATGLDASVLSGTTQDGTTVYTVTQPINTPGGKLQGYEINFQRPFTFLPGFWKHFGGVANLTHVESKIQYVVASTATSVTYREANLVGLSPDAWNLTLYYEDGPFSARVSEAYRSSYISIVLPGSGADFQGKNETHNIDMQVTYKLNKHFTAVFEGLNLTDQYDDRNDQYNTTQGNTGQNLLLDYSHPGRQFFLGVRYKY